MNQEQAFGIVRWLAATGIGYLVGKGIITAGVAEQIVGVVVSIAGIAWSVWSNREKPPA